MAQEKTQSIVSLSQNLASTLLLDFGHFFLGRFL
jgi:hypothetical protein